MADEPSEYEKYASAHPWRVGLVGGGLAFIWGLGITRSVTWSCIGGLITLFVCWSMWREGSVLFRFRTYLIRRFPRWFRKR